MSAIFFKSTPVGSLLPLKFNQRQPYLVKTMMMPSSLREMTMSAKTGSFIRGLAKTYQLPPEQASKIAFAVLRAAVGEIALAKLASVLSSELQLANDKAQKIAQEIEKDLFAPVSRELGQYLETRRHKQETSRGEQAKKAGASNVLNLKVQQQPPKPPMIPGTGNR